MARVRMSGQKQESMEFDKWAGVVGSDEQKAIWAYLDSGKGSLIVEAVAGSGKTYTGVEWCKRAGDAGRIGFVAFNKHIATELQTRLNGVGNVEAMTYHSLGFKLIRQAFRGVKVDQYKVDGILDQISLPVAKEDEERNAKYKIKRVVGLAKQYCVRERADLERVVDHHDVELNGCEEIVYSYMPMVLDKCKQQTSVVDFDDMVWLPKELQLRGARYDVLLIDEAQDTNIAQQWLALESSKRLVVIGDSHQAIYGFRGSDSESMGRIKRALADRGDKVAELPLSVTRRCPKAHVKLAQRVVSQIKAMEDSQEGVIGAVGKDKAVYGGIKEGDLVISRVNAELIGTAYALLKQGVRAVVRGRDIGQGLTKLVDKAVRMSGMENPSLPVVMGIMGEITEQEVAKFRAIPHGRGEMRAANSQDKMDCLNELASECKDLVELRGVITKLFADFDASGKPANSVVLGTVHRTKGLESERVWVLRPELMPHPMAKQPWEYKQELNLAYVAVTRSKRELYWVGDCPSVFA